MKKILLTVFMVLVMTIPAFAEEIPEAAETTLVEEVSVEEAVPEEEVIPAETPVEEILVEETPMNLPVEEVIPAEKVASTEEVVTEAPAVVEETSWDRYYVVLARVKLATGKVDISDLGIKSSEKEDLSAVISEGCEDFSLLCKSGIVTAVVVEEEVVGSQETNQVENPEVDENPKIIETQEVVKTQEVIKSQEAIENQNTVDKVAEPLPPIRNEESSGVLNIILSAGLYAWAGMKFVMLLIG